MPLELQTLEEGFRHSQGTPAIPFKISPGTEAPGNTRVTYFSRFKPPNNPIISYSGHFLSETKKQSSERVWNFWVYDNKRNPGFKARLISSPVNFPGLLTVSPVLVFFFCADPLWESLITSVVGILNLQGLDPIHQPGWTSASGSR